VAKKKAANLLPKLTETEQNLVSHIQDGFQLETDSLGGNPVLRRLKDDEEIALSLPIAIPSRRWNSADSSARQRSRCAYYRVASEKENEIGPRLRTLFWQGHQE
jgi:hypothetical protein